ncbi:hypothetical protein KA977_10845 [Candidatus Dependentiae bacterium]|nr:hypothetical protein [Candidatus Dependentiae bacterium]
MSKDLLNFFNGNNRGLLKYYLDCKLPDNLNIAWYPSAGKDFRALLYLTQKYAELNPASSNENFFPNFYLFTDYDNYFFSSIYENSTIHSDKNTEIILNNYEELPNLELPLDKEIVNCYEGSEMTGRLFFLEIQVKSKKIGDFICPVIYAFVENESFCSKILLSQKTSLSHIIHIRYGAPSGGGKASGIWLLNVLKKLNCKVFISDGSFNLSDGDIAAYTLYPNLKGEPPVMETIRKINSESWSGHGNVSWNIIKN